MALLGTNGKSTLIKCLMGMVTPEAGEIFLETDAGRVATSLPSGSRPSW